MSYQKGELRFGDCFDSEGEAIYLPHSCDEWVIGGKKEAQDLIEDLQEMIKKT